MRASETNPPTIPLNVPFRNPCELPGPCVCPACSAAASIQAWKVPWEALGPETGEEERAKMTRPCEHWAHDSRTALCVQSLLRLYLVWRPLSQSVQQ